MIYPNAKRLKPTKAGSFFKKIIRPQLPPAAAMGTDNAALNLLDSPLSEVDHDTISASARRMMILGLC